MAMIRIGKGSIAPAPLWAMMSVVAEEIAELDDRRDQRDDEEDPHRPRTGKQADRAEQARSITARAKT